MPPAKLGVRQCLGAGAAGNVILPAVEECHENIVAAGCAGRQIEVVEFETRLEKRANAAETVILARKKAGWKVVGYFKVRGALTA